MESLLRNLFITLLVFFSSSATAETSFMVSPSLGTGNVSGYHNTGYIRIDGSFYPMPQLGFNLFYADYADFETKNGGTPASLSLNGYGVGVVGRWPLHLNIQPFIRGEYFSWDSEVNSLGGTVGADSDFSTGFALGVQFPIKNFFGLKVEVFRYSDVSGADIDQFSFGATFEF